MDRGGPALGVVRTAPDPAEHHAPAAALVDQPQALLLDLLGGVEVVVDGLGDRGEPRARLGELGQHGVALGHVGHDPVDDQATVRVAVRPHPLPGPDRGAVGAPHAVVHLGGLAGQEQRVDAAVDVAVLGVDGVEPRALGILAGPQRPPQEALRRRAAVVLHEAAVGEQLAAVDVLVERPHDPLEVAGRGRVAHAGRQLELERHAGRSVQRRVERHRLACQEALELGRCHQRAAVRRARRASPSGRRCALTRRALAGPCAARPAGGGAARPRRRGRPRGPARRPGRSGSRRSGASPRSRPRASARARRPGRR